jgi:hypothetical protein
MMVEYSKGPNLAFQKELQDNPIPVLNGQCRLQIPTEEHPEISSHHPRLGHQLVGSSLSCHFASSAK